MINKLRLKKTYTKRFVNETTDSDEEKSEDKDIQKSIKSPTEVNSSPEISSNNKKFTNFKVFVKNYGQNVERVVDTKADNNPFAVEEVLDKLMSCQNLDQIEKVLEENDRRHDSEDKCQTEIELIKNSDEFKIKVKELEMEGIRRMRDSKSCPIFKCLICDISLIGLKVATNHIENEIHTKIKYGDHLKGIDALFTIDSEDIGDVKIAIRRRRELKKMSSETKQKYFDHGIRLKDGFGSNAYICSKCDLSFKSLKEIQKHMNSFESNESKPVVKSDEFSNDSQNTVQDPISQLDKKLQLEGLKTIYLSNYGTKFFCIFCNIYFDNKRLATNHIMNPKHKEKKRGENLPKIDSEFTLPSKRIDELEVAFSRKWHLKTIPPKTKEELTNHSIRLEDGIGSNAFKCLKCELYLENLDQIKEHIQSLIHLK